MENRIMLGFTEAESITIPLRLSMSNQVHWLICGGSGSGKSVLSLYLLNQLVEFASELFVADFKNTRDYEGITSNYGIGEECVSVFLKFYEQYQAIKEGREKGRIWLVWDEMAGNLLWLEGKDKKIHQEVKSKMGEVLMMGRELKGGSAGIITILQRPDSSHFSSGSRENYHVKILLGASSSESRKMIGLIAEELPVGYRAGVGRGLLISTENPLPLAFSVPQIDKNRLSLLLRKKHSLKK